MHCPLPEPHSRDQGVQLKILTHTHTPTHTPERENMKAWAEDRHMCAHALLYEEILLCLCEREQDEVILPVRGPGR